MKTGFTLLALTFVLGACSAGLPETKPAAKALPYAPPPPALLDEGAACAADVRLCADGSTVSRTAPKCEFSACPSGIKQ